MRSCGGRDVDYTEYIDMYIRQKIFEEQQQQQGDDPRRHAPRAWIRETLLKNIYVLVTVIFMAWTTRYANHRTMFLTSTAIRECVVCVCTE